MYRHKNGIGLRKVHTGDLHSLLQLKNESWWGTHNTSIINIEDQRNWYDHLGHDSLAMIAERHDSKSPTSVGVALYQNIDWFARTLRLSGSIFKEERKMNEVVKPAFACGLDFCFEVLNMQRVEAEVLETHLAAQWLEVGYLGFKVEGTRRKAVFKSGRYYDSIMLGILREEWEQTDRVKKYLESETQCCNDVFDHVEATRLANASKKWINAPLSEE